MAIQGIKPRVRQEPPPLRQSPVPAASLHPVDPRRGTCDKKEQPPAGRCARAEEQGDEGVGAEDIGEHGYADGQISQARVDASVTRILAAKEELHLLFRALTASAKPG